MKGLSYVALALSVIALALSLYAFTGGFSGAGTAIVSSGTTTGQSDMTKNEQILELYSVNALTRRQASISSSSDPNNSVTITYRPFIHNFAKAGTDSSALAAGKILNEKVPQPLIFYVTGLSASATAQDNIRTNIGLVESATPNVAAAITNGFDVASFKTQIVDIALKDLVAEGFKTAEPSQVVVMFDPAVKASSNAATDALMKMFVKTVLAQ